jgi:hypothetical protein
MKADEESPRANAVEIDDIPNAKREYRVEFVEPIEVLTVEKYDKKFDVFPIVVDRVLKELNEIFERINILDESVE